MAIQSLQENGWISCVHENEARKSIRLIVILLIGEEKDYEMAEFYLIFVSQLSSSNRHIDIKPRGYREFQKFCSGFVFLRYAVSEESSASNSINQF